MSPVKVTFEEVKTGKQVVVTITPNADDSSNISFDFGEDGAKSHDGPHIGMLNLFVEAIGIVK